MEKLSDPLEKSIPGIGHISDVKIRDDTAYVFAQLLKESKWSNLADQPIVSTINVSGVEHINAVVEICIEVGKILQKYHKIQVNLDYLISGAILHDASKLVEYEPTKEGEKKTKLGELGQHSIRCVSLMFARSMPEEIIHIVLSHTPQSATLPKTVESTILYFADSMDYNVLRVVSGLGTDIKK